MFEFIYKNKPKYLEISFYIRIFAPVEKNND